MTDLRDAVRALRATPLVTAVALLSLALGIGANTAIFSIVDSLVLRPLPVPHADRLALVAGDDDWYSTWFSNPIWEEIRDRRELFDGAFAYSETRFDLSPSGRAEFVDGLRASGSMFEVLGVEAALGRTFTEADDARGGGADGPVAVISHEFWERRFGGTRDVIGTTFTPRDARSGGDPVPYTIIGVTPAGFFGPDVGRRFDVAVPLGTLPPGRLESRSSWWLHVMVRLAPGQSREAGAAALRSVQAQIADATRPGDLRPEDAAAHLSHPFNLLPAAAGTSELRRDYRRPLYAVMAIVALTLLIACGNIANLQLARAAVRRHEIGVRTALGASRWRLVRQLFAESLLLAGIGAALGVGFALWGSRVIVAQLSTDTGGVFLDLGLHWRILGFTAALAVATALLFGMVPALSGARVAPSVAMKEQGRGAASGRRARVAGSFVVAQVALSLVLLIAAGLFVRMFLAQSTRDLGFERDRALLVRMETQRAGLNGAEREALYHRIRDGAAGLPGVSHAALSYTTPLGDNTMRRRMVFPDRPDLPESERIVLRHFVGPGWFAAMGTPLLAGRDFDGRDRFGAPRTLVVNQAFAEKYFGGESPVGRTIFEDPEPGSDPSPIDILGVVGDAVYRSLRQPDQPTMYWPLAQMGGPRPNGGPPADVTLVVRASEGSPVALARAATDVVAGTNPDISLTVRPFADQVDASLTQERLLARLTGFFGVLALLLAALGLYGITAYAVSQRRTELGLRMALGSSPAGVLRLVLGRVALLMAGGILAGALVSWWASRFLASLLYGLSPGDPATVGGATAVLVLAGTLAGWLPARRASRIEPARVLRDG